MTPQRPPETASSTPVPQRNAHTQREPRWRNANLLILLLAACLLASFFLRTRLDAPEGWRQMPLSRGNLFMQNPFVWLTGKGYAPDAVQDALADAAHRLAGSPAPRGTALSGSVPDSSKSRPGATIRAIPVIVCALSSRQDAPVDSATSSISPDLSPALPPGWTAELGYLSVFPDGNYVQTHPSLIRYAALQTMVPSPAPGTARGEDGPAFAPAANLALLLALTAQPFARVTTVEAAPFAVRLLREAARSLPPVERNRMVTLLREVATAPQDRGGRNASFRVLFAPVSPRETSLD